MSQNAAIDVHAIRRRAYERWLQRGCPTGCPDQDWLEAERELLSEAEAPAPRPRGVTVTSAATPGAPAPRVPRPRAPRAIVTRSAATPAARLLVALVPQTSASASSVRGASAVSPAPNPRSSAPGRR